MRNSFVVFLVLAACLTASADSASTLADRKALFADRQEAVDAMRKDGTAAKAVELLSKRLTDASESDGEKRVCVELAARLGPDGRALKPVLLAMVKKGPEDLIDPRPLRAALALGSVAPDDEEAFAAVRDAMPKELDFMGAMWADPLSKFGARAVPIFTEWTKSDDVAARLMAAKSLGNCGPSAVPPLMKALADDEHWISLAAAESLRKCGAPAKDVVPKIAERLDPANPRGSAAAIDALGRFGKDAAPAADRIRPFVSSSEVYVQLVAADALFLVTGELDDASVTKCAAALAVTNVPVHHRAAEALRDYGPRSKPALQKIARAMYRVTRSSRAVLCDAIAGMGDAAKPEGVAILRALVRGDPDPLPDEEPKRMRGMDDRVGHEDLEAAIRALGKLGAKEAAPDLRDAIKRWERPDMGEAEQLLLRYAKETLAQLGG